jgi:hypothetical protein
MRTFGNQKQMYTSSAKQTSVRSAAKGEPLLPDHHQDGFLQVR